MDMVIPGLRKLNQQESHACNALRHYIERKPDHPNGLCWWLTLCGRPSAREYVPGMGEVAGYTLVGAASDLMPEYPHLSWYTLRCGPGAQPERVELAQKVLDLIESGRCFFNPRIEAWESN